MQTKIAELHRTLFEHYWWTSLVYVIIIACFPAKHASRWQVEAHRSLKNELPADVSLLLVLCTRHWPSNLTIYHLGRCAATLLLPFFVAEANGLSCRKRRLVGSLFCRHVSATHEPVDFGKNPLKGRVYPRSIES